MQRTIKRRDFEHLQRVIQEYDVREIVVGFPLRMSGAEGTQSEKMLVFAEELRKRFRLPVHLWDERLTSAEANRLLLRETDLSRLSSGEGGGSDGAVILILQGWMEHRAGASGFGFRLPVLSECFLADFLPFPKRVSMILLSESFVTTGHNFL